MSCKICFDDINFKDQQSYLCPCKCSGTIKYVHASCLFNYLSVDAKKFCTVCLHPWEFLSWYHYTFCAILSVVIHFSILMGYIFLENAITSNLTFHSALIFKMRHPCIVLLNFWLASSILLMVNFAIGQSDIKISRIAVVPIYSMIVTYNSLIHSLTRRYSTLLSSNFLSSTK
jgi:E3 ubiquitin-protein ligase DOA10